MNRDSRVDMSSEAIARRLKETSRLRDLCRRLQEACLLGPVEPEEGNRQEPSRVVSPHPPDPRNHV